jgi:hydrogenase maturation protein HypF
MGRLFDAVSALVGVRQVVAYEAQAAIELEGVSREADGGTTRYEFAVDVSAAPTVINPAPVLAAIVSDMRAGIRASVIGARFHRAVAELIVDLAGAEDPVPQTVALTGGVFQNTLLLRLARNGLVAKGFDVITHRHVPPNDGGIALGQLMVGNAG